MRNAELAFQAKDVHLQVRTFSVEEAFSQPFEVFVTARSESSDLDLDAIVGHPAAFRLAIPADVPLDEAPFRVWSGLCSHMELVQIEPDGLSTYWLRIVPMLWRATQRRNHRIFQHVTVADIATGLLGEWGIDPRLAVDRGALARHEYRVQYGETDFAFVSRILEEAAISYRFDELEPQKRHRKGEEVLPTMQLVLMDRPVDAARRLAAPLPFIGDTADRPVTPFVRQVRVSHQVRPGRFTVRDYDFRSSPDLELLASARVRMALEESYEMYHYQPGAFVLEGTGARGGAADARVDEQYAQRMVDSRLDATRTGRRTVRFHTNVLELTPGLVFSMTGHPRVELNAEQGLICTRMSIEGDVEQLTEIQAEAAFVTDPLRPALRTPKPRINGVQSAIVVGPKGEEIYTDRFGRVRVQFHWDRLGKHDEQSSCWVRVSQAWAGAGYGIQSVPRVGQEVLVDFFEGDPDQPVITGRVHNSACNTAYPLPEHKTKTVWKSSTSPGASGSNEITFEDARGEELVYVHAQRNLERRVEVNEVAIVGANLRTSIGANERRQVEGEQIIVVSGDRNVDVAGNHSMKASGLRAQAGETTGMYCQGSKLVLTNGTTSIVLDGPNVYLDAGGTLQLSAGRSLSLSGEQVRIDGNPNVYVNCGQALPPSVQSFAVLAAGRTAEGTVDPSTDRSQRRRGRGDQQMPDALTERLSLAEMPPDIELPPEINEQIQRVAEVAEERGEAETKIVESSIYDKIKKQVRRRLDREIARLEKLRDDAHGIFDEQREHVEKLADRLKGRLGEEWATVQQNWAESKAILASDAKFVDKCKALYKVFQGQVKRIQALRKDLTDMFNREKRVFQGYIQKWKDFGEQVRSTIDHFKEFIDNPKDAILSLIFGEERAQELLEKWDQLQDAMGYAPQVSVAGGGTPGLPTLPSSGTTPAAPPGLEAGPQGTGGMRPGQVGHTPATGNPNPSMGSSMGGPGKPSLEAGHSLGQTAGQSPIGGDPGPLRPGESIGRTPIGSEPRPIGSQGVGPSALQRPGGAAEMAPGAALGGHGQPMSSMANTNSNVPLGGHDIAGRDAASSSFGGPGAPGDHASSLGSRSVASTGPSSLSGGGSHIGANLESMGGVPEASMGAPSGGMDHAAALGNAGTLASGAGAEAGSGEVGTAFARRGGLAANDVSSTVTPNGMSVLQSPQDGQLMVVASQSAQPLQPNALTNAAVDAQMAGRPAAEGMSAALEQNGYAVYERPWGDYLGKFVRVAGSQA